MNIRNFAIIAHIDHGKSTLADRLLELTGTIPKGKLIPQYLDRLSLERERGITIKMQPVRMLWHPHRRMTQNTTQNNAEDFLYEDLTYKIRGLLFQVRKRIGLGHKEQVYHNALEIEFKNGGLKFESKKNIPILYNGKSIGVYQPDFVIEDKILIELKALPEIGKPQIEQIWSYLKGCDYKLALLVNFGSKDLGIKRFVYDLARDSSALSASSPRMSAQVEDYILNLIDTPGHTDFTYEVSRALKAVEGAVLLVDAAKGVQAQTVFNFKKAVEQKLAIIPVINKIDLPNADIPRVEKQIIYLFEGSGFRVQGSEILKISAKTGQGVVELLETIIEKVPPPNLTKSDFVNFQAITGEARKVLTESQALIFDSLYDQFKGVLAYVRVFSGSVKAGETVELASLKKKFGIKEVGIFTPDFKPVEALVAGEIGYIATGIKEPGVVKIGDTIRSEGAPILEGFSQPQPKVFASFYPLEEGEFEALKSALEKFTLTDPAVSFERTESPLLGRGFRCGFLGKLHMEIAAARLDEELETEIIVGTPSVAYTVDGTTITSPIDFPEHTKGHDVEEPWVRVHLFTPSSYLGAVLRLLKDSDGIVTETSFLDGKSTKVLCEMPLAQIVTKNFYDTLKSVSRGFASLEYEPLEYRKSDAVRLDILVSGEYIDAFSKILPRRDAYSEGRRLTKLLKEILPKAQFVVSLQARLEGKCIAREDIPALKKAVTAPLYGGDWSRKKKLLVKQRKGKERLRQFGKVAIPKEVFLKMI